ncbi:hypothetical protein C8R48DRAFT_830409 [Suillus tomentosus]|nr:hypothetical protein C8R48DRAFT_830409 [Suillus tomentosus]
MDQYGQTSCTQTVNINTQPTGTIPESVYQNETVIIVEEDDELYGDHTELEQRYGADQQVLEELYKSRVKPGGSQSAITHKTWEVARDDQDESEEGHGAFTESSLPEIPDSGNYTEHPTTETDPEVEPGSESSSITENPFSEGPMSLQSNSTTTSTSTGGAQTGESRDLVPQDQTFRTYILQYSMYYTNH